MKRSIGLLRVLDRTEEAIAAGMAIGRDAACDSDHPKQAAAVLVDLAIEHVGNGEKQTRLRA